ncbi:hypothetical protein LEMLEM_LOCUS10921 [Lemmus lemmus]
MSQGAHLTTLEAWKAVGQPFKEGASTGYSGNPERRHFLHSQRHFVLAKPASLKAQGSCTMGPQCQLRPHHALCQSSDPHPVSLMPSPQRQWDPGRFSVPERKMPSVIIATTM